MESPHPTYLINNVYGSGKLLLRRWKGGMSDYHGIIFTKKGGDTKRLEDLRGKLIAFEDPESIQAIFFRSTFFRGRDLSFRKKRKSTAMFLAKKSVTFLSILRTNSLTWFSQHKWRLERSATMIMPLLTPEKSRT
jgi:ABC transporter, phosphonate, periplasmic substrate-binding protein